MERENRPQGAAPETAANQSSGSLTATIHDAAEPCLLCPLCACGYPCRQVVVS